jgi:hypothetical protein
MALVRLARGDVRGAVASIAVALAEAAWDGLARARLLPAQVLLGKPCSGTALATTRWWSSTPPWRPSSPWEQSSICNARLGSWPMDYLTISTSNSVIDSMTASSTNRRRACALTVMGSGGS